MTRYKEKIHQLRAKNKTYKQIAQELGIHHSTVHRALKPDSYALQKEQKRAYYQINYPRTRGRKVDCPTCSGKMNVGSKTCFNCYSNTIKSGTKQQL